MKFLTLLLLLIATVSLVLSAPIPSNPESPLDNWGVSKALSQLKRSVISTRISGSYRRPGRGKPVKRSAEASWLDMVERAVVATYRQRKSGHGEPVV